MINLLICIPTQRRKLGFQPMLKPKTYIRDSRMYPLLLKKFEETGGYPQPEDLDELEAEGELTRRQIKNWFHNHRQGYN